MDRRLKLHQVFEGILGSENVYFQPPSGFIMDYPAIVYNIGEIGFRTNLSVAFSNNKHYLGRKTYTVTYIDPDPDSLIPDKLEQLEYCSFARAFPADNLNHHVFVLYW